MGEVEVIIPRVKHGKLFEVHATVSLQKWASTDKDLLRTLNFIHLQTGHHADRDLELGQLAVKYLGGKLVDHRKKAEPKELPK